MHSKNKGNSGEREIVSIAKSHNLTATRIPLSGSMQNFKGDVLIEGKIYGVKRWKRILPKAVKEDLEKFTGCFIREDRGKWYVIIPAEYFFELVKKEAKNEPVIDVFF